MSNDANPVPSEEPDDRSTEPLHSPDDAPESDEAEGSESESLGRDAEIVLAANGIAENLNVDPVELAKVVRFIDRRRYEPGKRNPHENELRGWAILRNAQSAAAAKLHAAACEFWALRGSDSLIMSAVRFKCAMSIAPYIEAVRVLAHSPARKENVSPDDAMLRGLMYPIVYFNLMQSAFVTPDLTGRDAHARFSLALLMQTLRAAEWDFSESDIIENYDEVRESLHNQLTEDGGEFPEDDPEIKVGDEFDAEGGWLQDGDFLSTGTYAD